MTVPLLSLTTGRPSRRPVDRDELSARLLGSAARRYHDPAVDIDRAAPLPTQLYGLSPEWSTPFGTPSWETRATISPTVHEHCSISGIG